MPTAHRPCTRSRRRLRSGDVGQRALRGETRRGSGSARSSPSHLRQKSGVEQQRRLAQRLSLEPSMNLVELGEQRLSKLWVTWAFSALESS